MEELSCRKRHAFGFTHFLYIPQFLLQYLQSFSQYDLRYLPDSIVQSLLDWTYGTVLLRHTLDVLLIALHIWTSISVFEELGDFGWFYFLDEYSVTLESTDF